MDIMSGSTRPPASRLPPGRSLRPPGIPGDDPSPSFTSKSGAPAAPSTLAPGSGSTARAPRFVPECPNSDVRQGTLGVGARFCGSGGTPSRMSKSAPERAPTTPWSSLEPYTQLLRALLPRMNSLSVFDPHGHMHWSSEMSVAPEIASVVAEAVKDSVREPGSFGVQRMAGSEPIYLFWLMADDAAVDAAPFVVVAISFRQNSDGEQRSFAFVHGLVKPALECLRRELLARHEILNLHSSLAEQDNDLEMLLSVSGGGPDAKPESATDLKDIVGSATEHLKVGLAALIIPERGIAVVHASAEAPLDTSLVAKAHRHLLSMAQVRRGAAIVNRMVLQTGASEVAYRVLACPVARADGRCVGVLALFRAETAPEFTPHHSRLTELLARRVAAVLANSYDALTGLLTRPAFEQRVRRALEDGPNATGSRPVPWSALFIDINRLHVINDNYGMPMGDRVITLLGELIRNRMPPGSCGARISGDRFAIMLPAALEDGAKFGAGPPQGPERGRCLAGRWQDAGLDQRRCRRGGGAYQGVRACLCRRRDRLQGRQRSRPQSRRGVSRGRREHRSPLHRHQLDQRSARCH